MDILLVLLFLICFAIFAFYMAIKGLKEPTFAGYLMEGSMPSDNLCLVKLKNDGLVVSTAALPSKSLFEFKLNDIEAFDLRREIKPDEVTEMDKSVIGRSIVGGILLAPLGLTAVGAVVGGMSGIGTKQKIKKGEINTFAYIQAKNSQEFLFKITLAHESTALIFLSKYKKLKGLVNVS